MSLTRIDDALIDTSRLLSLQRTNGWMGNDQPPRYFEAIFDNGHTVKVPESIGEAILAQYVDASKPASGTIETSSDKAT